jgi:hypothetical protein
MLERVVELPVVIASSLTPAAPAPLTTCLAQSAFQPLACDFGILGVIEAQILKIVSLVG